MRRFVFGAVLLVSIGCGGKHQDAASPAAELPPDLGATQVAAGRSVLVLEAVREGATSAGFVNVKRMRDAGWLTALRAGLEGFPDPRVLGRLRRFEKKCGTDPLAALDEVAWSANESDLLVVGKLAISPDTALACVRGMTGASEAITVAGLPAWRLGSMAVMVHEDHLVVGSDGWIEAFIQGSAKGGELRAKVAPASDTIAKFVADDTSASISSTAVRLTADLELALEDEAVAANVVKEIEQARSELAADSKAVGLPAPSIERNGKSVHVGISVEGDSAKQGAALIGTLSAIATHGVRRYLTASKAVEAKVYVTSIGRGLVAATERETGDGKPTHRFPPSAPAVPSKVPAGKPHPSSGADWQHPSWRAIRFEMSQPQYYRYSFDTSKDGKKCIVVARGDLDGDGIQSKFSLELTIDAGNAVKVGELAVENELE